MAINNIITTCGHEFRMELLVDLPFVFESIGFIHYEMKQN